jgi:peptidoglycan/LPS O-acetylase OafA/YrhL
VPYDMCMSEMTRDRFVDLVKAVSLTVVVVWHWAFTIIVIEPDGMYPTNPVGFTSGLWLLTWLLQVMPLFFFVGGWANLSSWRKAEAAGVPLKSFIRRRVQQLAVPALALVGGWWALTVALTSLYDVAWLWDVALLVVSPLWFAATYLLIIVLMPVWLWLHRRFGVLVPVFLGGAAALVDVARFNHEWQWAGWLNMIFVWGLAHQLGFFYDKWTSAPRQQSWATMWAGLFGLIGLVWAGLYPASMVGVPGDKFSNMAPPSLAIVALVVFQIGVLMLIRPWVLARLDRPRWARFTATLSTYSMPLYLLHTTGMVIAVVVFYLLTGQRAETLSISWLWWATRPLAIAFPLLATVPLLLLYGKITNRRQPKAITAGAAAENQR